MPRPKGRDLISGVEHASFDTHRLGHDIPFGTDPEPSISGFATAGGDARPAPSNHTHSFQSLIASGDPADVEAMMTHAGEGTMYFDGDTKTIKGKFSDGWYDLSGTRGDVEEQTGSSGTIFVGSYTFTGFADLSTASKWITTATVTYAAETTGTFLDYIILSVALSVGPVSGYGGSVGGQVGGSTSTDAASATTSNAGGSVLVICGIKSVNPGSLDVVDSMEFICELTSFRDR